MKDEDSSISIRRDTHDTLLCFSATGTLSSDVYQFRWHRAARAVSPRTCCRCREGERINALLPIHEYEPTSFVFFVTAQAR